MSFRLMPEEAVNIASAEDSGACIAATHHQGADVWQVHPPPNGTLLVRLQVVIGDQ